MTYSVVVAQQVSLLSEPVYRATPVRLHMQVQSYVGFVDPGVFTFMVDQVTDALAYSHVATVLDVAGVPYELNDGEFSRQDALDLYYENATDAEAAATDIRLRLQALCDNMQAMTDLGPAQTITISS